MSTTYTGVPLSLANYEGPNRFAYVVNGHGVTASEASRAIYFAKDKVKSGRVSRENVAVWSRNNAGDWAPNDVSNAELAKQIDKLFADGLVKTPSTSTTAKSSKTGLEAALLNQATISKTLAHNLAQGFTMDAADYRSLETAMLAVMDLTQQQGPELPPEE